MSNINPLDLEHIVDSPPSSDTTSITTTTSTTTAANASLSLHKETKQLSLLEKLANPQWWKNYLIDTSGSLVFWMPVMALFEYGTLDMEWEQVKHARVAAAFIHLGIMRPYNVVREYLANRWGVNYNSPWHHKIGVDSVAMLPVTTPAYAVILASAGASAKQVFLGLPADLALSLSLTALLYTPFADAWSKLLGKKPVLYNK